MSKKVAIIPGDGVGPEIASSAAAAIESLADDIEIINVDAGYDCYLRTGEILPLETVETISECDAVLLGCMNIPEGRAFRNPVDDIKKKMGLFTNAKFIQKMVPDVGIVDIDAVFFREENLYSDISELEEMDGASMTMKVSYASCKRMLQLVRKLAEAHDLHITCVHNTKRVPVVDGLFLKTFHEVMEGSKLEYSDEGIEGASSTIIMNPSRFQYVVSLNPYSDIISSEAAAMVGGAHLIPEAALGDDTGLFMPMHGPVLRLQGLNMANPTAMLMATSKMLKFIGYDNESERLKEAIRSAYKRGFRTPDVGGDTGTYDFTSQVIKICDTQ